MLGSGPASTFTEKLRDESVQCGGRGDSIGIENFGILLDCTTWRIALLTFAISLNFESSYNLNMESVVIYLIRNNTYKERDIIYVLQFENYILTKFSLKFETEKY